MSFQQKTLSALWGKKAKSARTVPEEPTESEPESAESLAATDSVAVESESDDDVSPHVTPDAPARKRVCLPLAAASQTSVRKPNLDSSGIGSIFQSEHQRWAVCPRNVSFKTKIEIVNNRWTLVKSFQNPVRVLNGKNRTFLPSWRDRFPWLDYSRCLDAAFCLPCLLFASSGQHLGPLYYLPFTNWLKAASEYSRHEGEKSHKTSMVQFSEFQSTASGQQADVATQLSSEHQRQADENMARLRSVISAIVFAPLAASGD